ncbi:hypothetical protein QTO34_001120 [Cnephaeus nilssonii]|uniref:Ethylmalonyl-CoA decarboxylase 1 n=1 Tax=Cnephaeus nilssonii TaxID=3371016 RepID=A0AA40HW55_CNENI|nr:hypothetical protein QTO34_001120 [Eptesicus nilssonii]
MDFSVSPTRIACRAPPGPSGAVLAEPPRTPLPSAGRADAVPSAAAGLRQRKSVCSSALLYAYVSFPEMAASLLKTSSMSIRTKLLHQTGLSLYNTSHGFHEEEVKKKLQQFPGGSIDLQKEDNGIGILTLNNPSKRNAFSGVMMLQLLEKVTELENWTEGKGLIVRGAKNTFSSGSDLNAVKALGTPEARWSGLMYVHAKHLNKIDEINDERECDQICSQGDGYNTKLGRSYPTG